MGYDSGDAYEKAVAERDVLNTRHAVSSLALEEALGFSVAAHRRAPDSSRGTLSLRLRGALAQKARASGAPNSCRWLPHPMGCEQEIS